MSFLNPNAFWLLLVLLIPVVIHLFNFRKFKVLYFSNVSFLTEVRSDSKSSNTLKRLLILLMRLLAFLFLVLALAQPIFNNTDGNGRQERNSGLLLDNSVSMGQNTLSGSDIISSAISFTINLLSKGDDRIDFVLTSSDSRLNETSSSWMEDKLPNLGISYNPLDFGQAVSKVKREFSGGVSLTIVSDFQASNFEGFEDVIEDSLFRYKLVSMSSNQVSNVYVDSVEIKSGEEFGTGNLIRFRIRNIGDRRDGVLVKLLSGNRLVSSFTVDLGADSNKWLEVEMAKGLDARASLEVEDEAFVYDNRFRFVVDEARIKKGVCLYESIANKSLLSVYQNERYFQFESYSINEVDPDVLLHADFVVLDALSSVPAWLRESLVGMKKPVIIFPGASINTESYSLLLNQSMTKADDTLRQTISRNSLKHPMFDGVFSRKEEYLSLPFMKPVLSPARTEDVLLASDLGQVLLSRQNEHFYVFTSPLIADYTNLDKHALFLPIMYLLTHDESEGKCAFDLEDRFLPVDVSLDNEGGSFVLSGGGQTLVPLARTIDGKDLIELPVALEKPDYYHLISAGDTIKTYAVNISKRESDLTTISNGQLQAWANEYSNVELLDKEEIEMILSDKKESNMPLWKYALILVLIFLIAEQTLLRVFK